MSGISIISLIVSAIIGISISGYKSINSNTKKPTIAPYRGVIGNSNDFKSFNKTSNKSFNKTFNKSVINKKPISRTKIKINPNYKNDPFIKKYDNWKYDIKLEEYKKNLEKIGGKKRSNKKQSNKRLLKKKSINKKNKPKTKKKLRN